MMPPAEIIAWRERHLDCHALGHKPEPGGFCAHCRPDWAGGPREERLCPGCKRPLNDRTTCPWSECRNAKRRARYAAKKAARP
jgi:predicted amidophosphoribosyltransferase